MGEDTTKGENRKSYDSLILGDFNIFIEIISK